jgi:uncharacterized protein YecE (DUF72 family)
MAEIRYGTCSWKYPSWAGIVYSSAEPANFLAEYAEKFDSVEIDQWFWSLFRPDRTVLPRPATVAEYRASVPDSFRFTIKAPNSITLTHFYKEKGDASLVPNPHFLERDLTLKFLDAVMRLGPCLGLVNFQFEYLNKQKTAGLGEFLDKLAAFFGELPTDVPYAVEIRNPSWLTERYFTSLAALGAAPVLLHGYYMPDVVGVWDTFRDSITGAPVIRLHGPDREGMERETGQNWGKIVKPRDDELDRIALAVHGMLKREGTVWMNVNNHYEGSAPLTIERLRQRIG